MLVIVQMKEHVPHFACLSLVFLGLVDAGEIAPARHGCLYCNSMTVIDYGSELVGKKGCGKCGRLVCNDWVIVV